MEEIFNGDLFDKPKVHYTDSFIKFLREDSLIF
jgi:hypothetical protein